jgi:hypothetical protein
MGRHEHTVHAQLEFGKASKYHTPEIARLIRCAGTTVGLSGLSKQKSNI